MLREDEDKIPRGAHNAHARTGHWLPYRRIGAADQNVPSAPETARALAVSASERATQVGEGNVRRRREGRWQEGESYVAERGHE